jgi:hypothetical protein
MNVNNISTEFKQYLSGFFDGDGCIAIEKQKFGYSLRISFLQSNEKILDIIKYRYPYLHKTHLTQRDSKSRIEFKLSGSGKQIEPLIDDLIQYTILKYHQLSIAKEFLPLIGKKNCNTEKESLFFKIKELKRENLYIKPYERLSIPYIAGLFDAEGCITLGNSLRVKITQKSDTTILKKIGELYDNYNNISNWSIAFYDNSSYLFLKDMQSFCIYKKQQIKDAIDYLNKTIDKQDVIENLKHEKSLDVEHEFLSQEQHRQYLIKCWKKYENFSTIDLLYTCKSAEIAKTNVIPKNDNKIYNLDDWNQFRIEPELEFCETNHQKSLYNYFRKKVSSLPYSGVVGRCIQILVKDKLTNKYIGILCLSSDVYSLGERDRYIGLNDDNKNQYLKYITNLSCCVPLQPFGFNTNGGKLIAKLAFSREVYEYYFNKYKEPLLGISTTSINGKSIQYSRLPELKFIGYTKGYGSIYIPDELYQQCRKYNDDYKLVTSESSNRVDKFSFVNTIVRHLGLSTELLKHGKQRGIYFGYLFDSKLQKITNLDTSLLQDVKTIGIEWSNRWCLRRLANLLESGRIKLNSELYTNETFKDSEFKQYTLPPKLTEDILTDQFILYVLDFKKSSKSLQKISEKILQEKNINISINTLSKIFTGKIKPKHITNIYTEKFNIQKVVQKNRKLSDEHIYYIKDQYDNSKNYQEIVNEMLNTYNIKISKATISDIILCKLKPTAPKDNNKTLNKRVIDHSQVINNKLKQLTDEQIIEIINSKTASTTSQQVSERFKSQYNIYISRDIVSKLWKNQLAEHLNDNIINNVAYIQMISKRNTKYKPPSKFTNDEINFIINCELSPTECSKLFYTTFGKTVTKQYVIKLKKHN